MAVYDASDGDILKFQNFHSSWKNVSHNLATSNAVIRSTGIQQAAAIDIMGGIGCAGSSVGSMAAVEPQLTSSF